ncbi:hypothetical protein LQZ19_15775 [Treponema primitia]|uniref:hypothetical protein n=1 Tax=Treponema primitia TaxID=88058 RepID=UPI00397F5863
MNEKERMTEEEFITKAKAMGMEESTIQKRINLNKKWTNEGYPAEWDTFLGPFTNPSDFS